MRIKILFLTQLFTTTGCEPGTQSHENGLLFSLRVADDVNISEILDLSSKALIGPYLLATFVWENKIIPLSVMQWRRKAYSIWTRSHLSDIPFCSHTAVLQIGKRIKKYLVGQPGFTILDMHHTAVTIASDYCGWG